MRRFVRKRWGIALIFWVFAGQHSAVGQQITATTDEARIEALMQRHQVPGLAVAVTEGSLVRYQKGFGLRDIDAGAPLTPETVMYGASLTKFVFAAFVARLAAEGRIDLDAPIGTLLPKPLPAYERFADLAGDPRWERLTLRILLSHTSGLPNYRFFPVEGGYDPDGKLQFYYEPGERYGYSGEGYYIAQLAVEQALALETEAILQRRFFQPRGMQRTSLVWQDHFRPNFSQGYTRDNENKGHNMQSNARAAGSMDTTLADFSRFMVGYFTGDAVAAAARRLQLTPGLPIMSDQQFPTLTRGDGTYVKAASLTAGLGVVMFDGPQGAGFFKGGHNEKTDNLLVCLIAQQRCLILFANTAKGDLIFPQLTQMFLGETGLPWSWEYSSLK